MPLAQLIGQSCCVVPGTIRVVLVRAALALLADRRYDCSQAEDARTVLALVDGSPWALDR